VQARRAMRAALFIFNAGIEQELVYSFPALCMRPMENKK
jgi:hypothetical protein